jgi:hypothetical protein
MALKSTIIRPSHGGWETIKPSSRVALNEQQRLLNRNGISKGNILTKLKAKLDATKPFAVADNVIYVDDNPTQIKAVELGLKLHGMIDRPADGPRVGTINILWTGSQPSWAMDNEMVNDGDGVPISTVEGTESAPGPSCDTHPAINLKSKRLSNGKVK